MMLENPILNRQPWENNEPESLGHCVGCKDQIMDYEEHLEVEEGLIHDDSLCAYQYMLMIAK